VIAFFPGAQQVVNERIASALINLDDPNIMLDLRQLNGRVCSNKVDAFWSELQVYLDEFNLAVDERHHSDVLHMPIAISIRHLQEIISDRLTAKNMDSGEHSVIPLACYQFWPRNHFSISALRYTGRFSVKFGVQLRKLQN